MKGILFIILATLVLACQQQDKQAGNQNSGIENVTTVKWLDSTKYLGRINEGEKVEMQYRFVNTGDIPLVVDKVTVSCGCTVVDKPTEPIAPGKEGVVKAVFDSKGKPGRNHKTIMVHTNTANFFDPLAFDVDVVPAN